MLEDVINETKKFVVSLIIPEEVLPQVAPLVRQFFSSVRTIKQRCSGAKPINFMIDEAARLGRFPELAELFSIGRGQGVTPIVFYQDDGQITRNLGQTGRTTIEANAALMIDLGGGIRDFETAKNRSQSLGFQTIHLDDPLTQNRAKNKAAEIERSVFLEGRTRFRLGWRYANLTTKRRIEPKCEKP